MTDRKSSRVSTGTQKSIDAAVEKALSDSQTKTKKPSVIRQLGGLACMVLWGVFLVAEFFGWVQHESDFSHNLITWGPLFVGLALLAPDAFDKMAGLISKAKNLRLVQKDTPEQE